MRQKYWPRLYTVYSTEFCLQAKKFFSSGTEFTCAPHQSSSVVYGRSIKEGEHCNFSVLIGYFPIYLQL